jgi:hypothetical protein
VKHESLTPQELFELVREYARSCRLHDARLLTAFFIVLAPTLMAVSGALWFRDANVLTVLPELGLFSKVWLGISFLGVAALAAHILFFSNRFHRNVVPRCQRCTCSIRNLDDFLMAMSMPGAMSSRAPSVECDVCKHVIARWDGGPFHAGAAA